MEKSKRWHRIAGWALTIFLILFLGGGLLSLNEQPMLTKLLYAIALIVVYVVYARALWIRDDARHEERLP